MDEAEKQAMTERRPETVENLERLGSVCLDPSVCNFPNGRCVEPSKCGEPQRYRRKELLDELTREGEEWPGGYQ